MTLLVEGLTHYLVLPWSVDLTFDVLTFSAIAVGAYLFSRYVFGIVEQKEAELRNSREQLRALARRLQSVREEERSRIAREVHDTLGQPMAALKIDLTWLASRVPADEATWHEKFRTTLALADSTIRSVRQIMTDLRPSLLDDLGLVAAVEWEAHEFQRRTGIRCEFVSDQPEPALPSEIGTAVFRICQEALTNTARHADATRVSIRLEQESEFLGLSVADNGRGITDGEIAAQTSLGLLGMRERALLLGGQLSIVGRPGEGTTVTLRLPLPMSNGGGNDGRHLSGEAPPTG
ncbi:MAG TPA: sensor histidine kinase [Candidatus Methylomirabilis sp.]|nr:sensor histidine kinase [Candidatus Methylomirabilis sp.]HSC70696.1 sensor histidine kinase [Candidatus Methylomirabilis sp.]